MKIIFVSDLDLWSMGTGRGGEAFIRTITKYKKMGDEVFLISDVNENRKSDLFDEGHNIVVSPSFFKKGIRIRKIGLIFRYIDHRLMNRKFIKIIEEIVNKRGKNETILYAYEIFGVKACRWVSGKYQIPYVSRFQGTQMVNFPYNRINQILRYPHYQALKSKADLIIMTDDGTKGDKILDEIGNYSRRLFLRNGLKLREQGLLAKLKYFNKDDLRKKLGIAEGETMFLTVSRLTGWKRVDRAIKGFSSFLERGGRGKLVIVGDGDQKNTLQDLTYQLKVDKYVVFVGAVKHEQVYYYMIAADIFLSLFDLSNVGNPLLEAMTLGKCIVTLDVGDTKKIISGNNGILLTIDEMKNLGNVLKEISEDSNRRKTYGYEAQKYAEKHFYTWEERMDIEYQELLKLVKKNKGSAI